MLKNYLKVAWRNVVKNRFYSVVNIIGLSAAFVFAFLIGAYVWNELQVNRKLRNADDQYFLASEWKDPNMGIDITTLGPLAKRLKEDYPGIVANYYRWDGITSVISKGDKHFREGIQLGDSTLLNMFGFELLQGNPQSALSEPYSVVLTKDRALKYFGRTDVVGETLIVQSFSGTTKEFKVTGVLKDIPENSVTHLNDANDNRIFIPTNSYAYFGRMDFENWNNLILPSYVELKKGYTAKDLEKPIEQLIRDNTTDQVKQNLTVKAIPLKDYYLQKNNHLVTRMLYTLSFVALFILLMAIVNFVNIAIARSSSRMREIGVRKVLGGLKNQLAIQFLSESFILVGLAASLALALYPAFKLVFVQIVGKEIPSLSAFPLYFILVPVLLVLITGLLAGFYPSIVLSSMKCVDSLKGKFKTTKENILFRKSLATFQFCIAGIVMVSAFIVTRQVSYFFGKGLGYDKEYVVSAQVPRNWSREGVQKMETVRNNFLNSIPEITQASLSYEIPNGMNGGQPYVYKFNTDSTTAVPMQSLVTDENYLSTYHIPLIAGSFFDNRGLDSGKVILNKKATEALGWKDEKDAVGRQIRIPGDATIFTVKGVTDDFHFSSMQHNIQPAIFFNVNFATAYRYLSFKIRPGNIATTIDKVSNKWATLLPGSSFEYSFMDDTLRNLYKSELQLKKASYAATLLSLIIALLGVLGLVSLSVRKRTKEIGIRKVLGASVTSVISLFVKEFSLIILVAGVIICPLAYLIMNKWLSDYAYRIDITAIPFITVLAAMTGLTIILIIFQTIKTALTNPVKSLRTE